MNDNRLESPDHTLKSDLGVGGNLQLITIKSQCYFLAVVLLLCTLDSGLK